MNPVELKTVHLRLGINIRYVKVVPKNLLNSNKKKLHLFCISQVALKIRKDRETFIYTTFL